MAKLQVSNAYAGETIWEAARRHGTVIPHLCYNPDQDGLRPDGNCRVCLCEIEGERLLQPSCWRKPTEGMKVSSKSERARVPRGPGQRRHRLCAAWRGFTHHVRH